VLEEHNFMTRWMQENYQTQRDPLRRARYWLTFWKYRRYEARVYSYFDACTMVSEIDASAARQLLPNPPLIRVVPNCVDLEYYACNAFMPQPQTLIFNGSLTYSVNLEAIRYFLREIWPLIRAQAPNARLRITGRTTESAATEFSLDGITLTGFLDDIRPAVGSSWVCVVPLRSGSGTRLKVLEAMALGTPVVSTAKGAEGLDVTHGENILIADEPAEFARHTLAVLNDIQLRTHLATNARRLVETTYDWKLAGAKFEALLQEVVERRRA
jgi:glycosyltransferase involved in cell wall biosynthesis